MIEVQELTKVYGDRVAVDHISFHVERGEIVGFLGQNGAGKTTTMKIITCFMAASSGTAKVAGFDVFEHPIEVKKRIGYLPESPPLYNELLVSEYLRFVAELKLIPRIERGACIKSVIEQCRLGDVQNRLIGNLSKGYRQRVGLAQALIHNPQVLILDEPTIGLDPKQVNETRSLIRSLRKERTVIYSTHILSEVAATCDRIIVIDQGKIITQETINALGSAGATAKTEILVQKMPEGMVSALRAIRGIKNIEPSSNGANRLVIESEANENIMSEISKVIVGQNAGLVRMSPIQLELEKHYLDLIGATRSST